MTTKTSITLSPKKRRGQGSPNLKKRRSASSSFIQQQQLSTHLSLILFTRPSCPAMITISCRKGIVASTPLPDLLRDIVIDERQEMIVSVATQLRKVGDQLEEDLQVIRDDSTCLRFVRKYLSMMITEMKHYV
jgi:hypothetical protein